MPKVKNLSGQKFGRLTVEDNYELIKRKDGNGTRSKWLCLCECGKKVWILRDLLITGKTRSCGCIFKDFKTSYYGITRRNDLYATYKLNAKNRKLSFSLTIEEFAKLTKDNCFFCNTEPYQILTSRTNNGDYIYNGIDRLDNKIGYTIINCVVACGNCNKAKGSKNIQQFYRYITKIYQYRGLDENN